MANPEQECSGIGAHIVTAPAQSVSEPIFSGSYFRSIFRWSHQLESGTLRIISTSLLRSLSCGFWPTMTRIRSVLLGNTFCKYAIVSADFGHGDSDASALWCVSTCLGAWPENKTRNHLEIRINKQELYAQTVSWDGSILELPFNKASVYTCLYCSNPSPFNKASVYTCSYCSNPSPFNKASNTLSHFSGHSLIGSYAYEWDTEF